MGNVDDGTFNREMKSDFAKTHIYSKPDCRNCWARFYCSGGCNANNYQYSGDVHKAYKLSCEIEKKASGMRHRAESHPHGSGCCKAGKR